MAVMPKPIVERVADQAIVIRDYDMTDYGSICALWQSTGLMSAERGDDARVIAHTLASGGRLWVATREDEARVVGTAWITNDARRLYLHHVAVLPKYQHQGVGRRLFD